MISSLRWSKASARPASSVTLLTRSVRVPRFAPACAYQMLSRSKRRADSGRRDRHDRLHDLEADVVAGGRRQVEVHGGQHEPRRRRVARVASDGLVRQGDGPEELAQLRFARLARMQEDERLGGMVHLVELVDQVFLSALHLGPHERRRRRIQPLQGEIVRERRRVHPCELFALLAKRVRQRRRGRPLQPGQRRRLREPEEPLEPVAQHDPLLGLLRLEARPLLRVEEHDGRLHGVDGDVLHGPLALEEQADDLFARPNRSRAARLQPALEVPDGQPQARHRHRLADPQVIEPLDDLRQRRTLRRGRRGPQDEAGDQDEDRAKGSHLFILKAGTE